MEKRSLIGGTIIAVYLVFAIISPYLLNEDAIKNWRTRAYWADYPRLVPPKWVNFFGKNLPPTEKITSTKISEGIYKMRYSFKYSEFPLNIKIKFPSVPNGDVMVNLTTPNGETYTIYKGPVSGGMNGAELNLGKDPNLVKIVANNMGFNITFDEALLTAVSSKGLVFMLGSKVGNKWKPNNGEYTFTVKSDVKPYLWITGKVYGVMGTDAYGRDIWQAFLVGTRQTLVLVFVTAFSSVLLGVALGLFGALSATIGKIVDGASRISGMLPTIPLLFALVPLTSSIMEYGDLKIPMWVFVLAISLTLFGKISQNVKAIVSVEMSKEYVESSKSLGASEWWILRKHVSKALLPYAGSQFVLVSAKTVVLVALLGFFYVIPGMNWGTLMAMVIVQRALYYNAWWMVVPVGVAITILAISSILLSSGIRQEGAIF